jgi:isochorismate synthase EntC
MRPVSFAVAAIAALATVLPASAQDSPSNAELYRMLKDQQKTLSEQQVLIGKLRAELRDNQAAHEKTRKDVRREDRRVRHLTAQVKKQSKLTISI